MVSQRRDRNDKNQGATNYDTEKQHAHDTCDQQRNTATEWRRLSCQIHTKTSTKPHKLIRIQTLLYKR